MTSKLRVTGLCAGNSPVPGEFPAQMDSNAENVSIWWRHHVMEVNTSSVTYVTNRSNVAETSSKSQAAFIAYQSNPTENLWSNINDKVNGFHSLEWRHNQRWYLKSPASSVFGQLLVPAQIKENIKAPRHCPLWGEFTSDRWIPRTKGW